MFRANNMMHAACVTALTSVALFMGAPIVAHAADAIKPALPAGAIAVVNGVVVPASRLDEAVRAVAQKTGQPDTPALRSALKSDLIACEVFRQDAEKDRYSSKPEVQQAIAIAKENAEVQLYLRDNVHAEAVTDDQVKARYDELVASLGKDEFKPRIITVPDESTAKTVLEKVKAGSAFEVVAKQYSIAPSKANGGELPWMSYPVPVTEGKTQGLPLALAQTIAKLPVGGVTPQPVLVGNVWAIVRLDAKRPTQIPAFDQAKDTLAKQLQTLALQKAAMEFTATQLRGASIQQ